MKEATANKIHLFLVLGAILIISFQNCGGGLQTISSNSISQGTAQTCPSNSLDCEMDDGFGQQICTQISPESISLGLCILTSCKTGFSLVNGSCVSNSCVPGSEVSCDLTNGTGTRACNQVGQYGPCSDLVCNVGFHISSLNVCVANVVSVLVNGANEFMAVPQQTYNFSVTASPGAALNNSESSLTAVSGTCPANKSCAPLNKALKPWTLDGTSGGQQLKIGSNSWNFNSTLALDMVGCQWKGCLQIDSGASSCVTIDTLCPAGKVLIGDACGVCATGTQYDSNTRACIVPPPPKTCTFNGKTLQSGEQVTTYNVTSVVDKDICANHKQIRTCNNGTLSGSYQYASCTEALPPPPPPPPPKTCTFNGKTLQYGEQVTAYNISAVTVTDGSDKCVFHQQVRTCYGDNNLTGTYQYASCTEAAPPPPPKTCTFNGKTLQYGEQVKAYNLSAVYGTDICANHQEVRTCYGDNNLSGSYPLASCTEAPPVVCLFGGKTVKYGDQVAAFSTGSAPGADICANHKEMRKCIGDNILSGSYSYASCIDDETPAPQPLACPAGLSTYNLNGLVCAYYCELYANTLPASYKCSNGIYITISACKSGPAYKGGIYMSSIPTKNAGYACNASNIYP